MALCDQDNHGVLCALYTQEIWVRVDCVVNMHTAPQHLVCGVVQSLHSNHMQMSIIEVFICRRLHMNTSMILICIWLICRLCTALHTKCCGAVMCTSSACWYDAFMALAETNGYSTEIRV